MIGLRLRHLTCPIASFAFCLLAAGDGPAQQKLLTLDVSSIPRPASTSRDRANGLTWLDDTTICGQPTGRPADPPMAAMAAGVELLKVNPSWRHLAVLRCEWSSTSALLDVTARKHAGCPGWAAIR
jgi:hypothetical protein